ncbi:YbaK/EbsC family protein [Marinobacter sp. M3C]|uniref:aminoacyl-tRNA deacylase n=1 Tax=unclassified Marinobacter TaxID=83889 RepID=UPI00200C74BB|nr:MULTISPECIES: YbaK/EbsC family protein [unclassified Marinobacter]MCL1478129.1 YbaK/EbsC family protein [Marinobacter sp.]MCL1480084.1 YbaK/EbsC family protein [Marinobacter sp.]MCL1484037.1 YbaK/EbsC family protein [Marinobacter sp.]MCL1486868.1 YbaK/EbsC family protein [Marinobacter sp.]UQG55713.1 YbaK/EbsC family protein [Marinobacter sp. M4C]
MPANALKQYLDSAGVEYLCMLHPPAFSARQLARHVGIAGDRVVKTVIIELDGKMAMLVMPATWRVRWQRLSQILDTDFVELADEQAFQNLFPQCEVGAMPPFGELYGMNVYCAEALTQQPELAFAAGSHSKSIHMKTTDFLALAQPMILNQGFNKPGVAKPAWLVKRKQPAASGSAQAL